MEPNLYLCACPCWKEYYIIYSRPQQQDQFSTDSKGRRVLHDSYLLPRGERRRHPVRGRMDKGGASVEWYTMDAKWEYSYLVWHVGKQTWMKGWGLKTDVGHRSRKSWEKRGKDAEGRACKQEITFKAYETQMGNQIQEAEDKNRKKRA